ncbi:MAG: GAF domain-containing sensor histidine kinase [Myxococcota bacterium]
MMQILSNNSPKISDQSQDKLVLLRKLYPDSAFLIYDAEAQFLDCSSNFSEIFGAGALSAKDPLQVILHNESPFSLFQIIKETKHSKGLLKHYLHISSQKDEVIHAACHFILFEQNQEHSLLLVILHLNSADQPAEINEKILLQQKLFRQTSLVDNLMIELNQIKKKHKDINDQFHLFARFVYFFNSIWDTKELIDGFLQLLSEVGISHVSSFYRYQQQESQFQLFADYGFEHSLPVKVSSQGGFFSEIIKTRSRKLLSLNCAGLNMELQTPMGRWKPGSIISFPVQYRGQLTGVLTLAFASQPSKDRLESFFEPLIQQLAIVFNSIKQYKDLRQQKAKLEEQTLEIERKNRLLLRSSEMKTSFLINISHELRTPLNAVLGLAQVLEDDSLGQLNQEQKTLVSEIIESGNQLLVLIRDLFTMTRLDSETPDLVSNEFNFIDFFNTTIKNWKEKALQKNMELNFSLPQQKEIILHTDQLKLRQIISSLLLLAIRYSSKEDKIEFKVFFPEPNELVLQLAGPDFPLCEQCPGKTGDLQYSEPFSNQNHLSTWKSSDFRIMLIFKLINSFDGIFNLEKNSDQKNQITIKLPKMQLAHEHIQNDS